MLQGPAKQVASDQPTKDNLSSVDEYLNSLGNSSVFAMNNSQASVKCGSFSDDVANFLDKDEDDLRAFDNVVMRKYVDFTVQ